MPEQADVLADVVLAISTFRTDSHVLAMLGRVLEMGQSPFADILVVDSLSDGSLGSEFVRRRWRVRYINADHNLGSAGNLALRLEEAARTRASWCYAINHDGLLDLDAVRSLVRCGRREQKVGTVYPLRVRSRRGNSIDPPRRNWLPLSHFRVPAERRQCSAELVAWSSSNGTLYNLAPTREGILVWADLWMGWEDLSYSWLLWKRGWNQILCPDARFVDPYEYRRVHFLGCPVYIHEKAPWVSYYTVRNLALFVRRTEAGPRGWLLVWWRWVRESGLVFFYKTEKLQRLRILWRGLRDGLRGRTGMVIPPSFNGRDDW